MRHTYTVSFHQARQYGVALYNLAIDTNNISKTFRISFDDNDLVRFLTKAYSAIIRSAGTPADSTAVNRILVLLHEMRSFAFLSSWQYKEFFSSSLSDLRKSHSL